MTDVDVGVAIAAATSSVAIVCGAGVVTFVVVRRRRRARRDKLMREEEERRKQEAEEEERRKKEEEEEEERKKEEEEAERKRLEEEEAERKKEEARRKAEKKKKKKKQQEAQAPNLQPALLKESTDPLEELPDPPLAIPREGDELKDVPAAGSTRDLVLKGLPEVYWIDYCEITLSCGDNKPQILCEQMDRLPRGPKAVSPEEELDIVFVVG
mmetsp:Transcript_22012/g.51655  ORF Transcript_22012/g.51655 Transcript_22012/m.51655 type:complete len:212 (+) Transcript_22012:22-657(+)